MKKLLSLIAAAMFAVGGVNAQTEETLQVKFDNKGWDENSGCIRVVDKLGENVQLKLTGLYQSFQIVNSENAFSPAGYKGMKVQYELDKANTSFINLHINVGKKEDGTGNDWDGMYQRLESDKTEISFDFSEAVLALKEIKLITLQQAKEGFANVLVKKIYLIKKDGKEEQLTPFAMAGDGLAGGDIWESAVLKYRGVYANVQLVDKDGNSLTYDPTINTKQIITIEYAEKPSINLAVLPNKEEKDIYGNYMPYTYALNANYDKKVEVTIDSTVDDGKITGPVVEMRLFANDENDTFPAEVKVKSITRGIINRTSSAVANQGSSTYWGTYSNNLANVELSGAGVEVYNLTLDDNKIVFTKRSDNKVAKGEGVIVKSSGESFNVAVIDETPVAATSNLLKATPTTAKTISSESKKLYCLSFQSGSNDKLGFYWGSNNGSSINAVPGKAYLAISTAEAASTKRSIVIDDPETTLVDGIKAEKMQEDAIYNLAGQRIKKLSKGVNVVGNKKVLVK